MAAENEKFLNRWSRLKHEAKQPVEQKEPGEPPPLPPLDKLTPESDFSAFMHPKVQDALRRVALKKLFSDPRFNVPDPFEAYSGDWTGGEPISEEMLATLNQARTLLFNENGKKDETAAEGGNPAAGEPPKLEQAQDDDAGRKDT